MILPLLTFCICQLVLPSTKLFYFAPFMAQTIYRCRHMTALWTALSVGLVVDIFVPHPLFGMHAFAYSAACGVLFKLRRHFFAQRWSTLMLMTFLFSFLVTAILWLFSFGQNPQLSFGVWWSDFIALPMLDAVFGTVCFLLPQLLFRKKYLKAPTDFAH